MKNGGQNPWNATPICETFKISCLMGRLHTKDVLENLLKDQSFRLVHWLTISPSLRKTSQESINLERKSYLDGSLDTLCTRVEFGRVTQLFLENQKGLHLHHLKTHIRVPVRQETISGPCQDTSYTAITLNPESNFTRREKNHSLFHWNTLTHPELQERIWMPCKNAASMTVEISMDQEICLILGQVSLSLLYWKRNLQTDFCGPGWDWQNGKRHPGQIIYGQNSGEDWQEMLSWGRSISGQLKNQSSIMLEDYEESISLTVRTRSSRKPSRMQEENWKHQQLQPCLARHARKASMERPVARLMISSLNLRVFWKPVNAQECVWKNLYQNIMRTILQEEVTSHCNITIWYTNLFLCRKQWRYPQQKHQWIKNGRNWKRFRRGT